MAEESKHEKIDGGRQAHPAYEPSASAKDRDSRYASRAVRVRLNSVVCSERQTLLAHLFQVSSDGIIVHELLSSPQMGRFIDVNDRMCQMLGLHARGDPELGPV